MGNKKTYRSGRQGDVLVIEGSLPKATKLVERENGCVVLAHGEVTGHAHAIKAESALLYLEEATIAAPDAMAALGIGGGLIPDRMLVLSESTSLEHEEHATVLFAAGEKIVRIQEEYHPEELRNVHD